MAKQPESAVREVEQIGSNIYRCPGCGELVDNRQMDAVLMHHQHVILAKSPPLWFEPAVRDAPAHTATPITINHPLRIHPEETYRASAAKRSRKDGLDSSRSPYRAMAVPRPREKVPAGGLSREQQAH